jgi:hypothetical protein
MSEIFLDMVGNEQEQETDKISKMGDRAMTFEKPSIPALHSVE